MISETVVELSRWQFAISAMFHFLFVPLTLGLSLLLASMESAYVLSGKACYKAGCQAWGRLLAVGFVLGVATRLAMIFQFGMNGSYFSHFVGDVFALPLAIEALSSFFLASLVFGPYLFGWERFGKGQHLLITWLMVLALNLSAIWVLIANAWMQNPVGAAFNYQSFRMELTDVSQLLTNPVAFAKALHTLAAAYVTASATILAINAWLLLKNPENTLASNCFRMAAPLGLIAVLILVGVGDNTPHQENAVQHRKQAIIDGENLDALLPDIESHIRSGIEAYGLLEQLRDNDKDPKLLANFAQHQADLGYAFLLKRWTEHIAEATDKQIKLAAQSALPGTPSLLYWSYRFMMACGAIAIVLFLSAQWPLLTKQAPPPWLLKLCLYGSPLPWLACIAGWFVSEGGKQPWAIAEILPTYLSFSSLSTKELIISLSAYFMVFVASSLVGLFVIRQTVKTQLNTAHGAKS